MNERIKELANEAGYNDQIYEISKQGLEKFAELIIKECVGLMESEQAMYADTCSYESREYYERMAAKEDAYGDAASTIKYHFGVK